MGLFPGPRLERSYLQSDGKAVADPEGPRVHGPQTHDRLKKSCESCYRRGSSVSKLAMIKFVTVLTAVEDNVQCPLLQELQRL